MLRKVYVAVRYQSVTEQGQHWAKITRVERVFKPMYAVERSCKHSIRLFYVSRVCLVTYAAAYCLHKEPSASRE